MYLESCQLILKKLVDKIKKVYIIERVEKSSRSVGQGVKTPPFHGGNTGSNPVRTMGVSRLMEIGFKKKLKKPVDREK